MALPTLRFSDGAVIRNAATVEVSEEETVEVVAGEETKEDDSLEARDEFSLEAEEKDKAEEECPASHPHEVKDKIAPQASERRMPFFMSRL